MGLAAATMGPKITRRRPAAAPRAAGDAAAEGAEAPPDKIRRRSGRSGPSGGAKATKARDAALARVQELEKALSSERKAKELAQAELSSQQRHWDIMASNLGVHIQRDAEGLHKWPAHVRAAAKKEARSPPPRRR